MKTSVLLSAIVLVTSLVAANPIPTTARVTHRQLQAVGADGKGTYNATDKVIISGIILNNPEDMLDPTPSAPVDLGGQWQFFIQGETDPNGKSDHAGTAVWIGKNYSRRGGQDYTAAEFTAELSRINRDPDTGYIFQAGDRVEVEGWYMFFGGKMNINEKHQKDPSHDFTIRLIKPAAGLPEPAEIELSDLKYPNDTFIFDPNRLEGPEFYQGRLVRVNNVTILDPENWGPGKTVTIMDDAGLTFPVKLGIGDGFSQYPCPAEWIDVIGIMNQEHSMCAVCDSGYEIWVVNYDGNGLVLTDRGRPRGNLPGDLNGDFKVDLADFARMAGNWLAERTGLYLP